MGKSGGEYEVKDGESVLDVLLASSVDAPYSCRQGICGECIVHVLACEPDHRDDILTKSTGPIEAVEQAEAAWLAALTKGEEAITSLMLEDSRAVHGPVGKIDDRETFAHFTWTPRRHVFAKAEDLSITVRGTTAITSCLLEMHIVFDENLPPFPVQEAVTRMWEETGEGWRLAHLHQAKRIPPG
ncbi:2Fe-2S iron-sulfur cluster-binding protein [Streptomyces canus]|uniref:2Fe-2S iron-sulfur cluster-binding protein n=1 Tax=Streptomyces canus TaxID=58343 RepID=UPI00324BDF91